MREVIKKFGAFSLGPLIGAVISFITVPIITHFITPDENGRASMFILAQSTMSTVMYLGMDQAFVREYNAFKKDIGKLMTNAIVIPMTIAVTSGIVIVLLARLVSSMLFGNDHEILAVYALAALLPFMIIENFSLLSIRMDEKGLLYSAFTILLKITILCLTVILFLTYQKSFRSVVYAAALAEIINGTILAFVVLLKNNLTLKNLDSVLIKRMLRFGLPLVPAFAIGWILTSMDKIMLRTMCTYDELGLYAAAFKIVSVLSVLQACFSLYWTPVAYRWYEQKKSEDSFTLVGNLVAFAMTIMCMLLLLFKDVVGIILGASFRAAITIFPFLLLYPILYTISETTAVGIGFKRKTAYNILISALSGGANIMLNWLLIPDLGGVGAAIATGLSYVVFFWGRTLVSRYIWYKMPVGLFAVMIVIILANCYVHTFMSGFIPSIVSVITGVILTMMLIAYLKKNDVIRKARRGELV